MTASRVVFHCNAGGGYGVGHLMRCVTLAAEATRQGWGVSLIGDLDAQARELVARTSPELETTSLPRAEHAAALVSSIEALGPDVVHVDSYWPEADGLHPGRFLLSNMQDGPFGVRPATLAIDSNLGAEARFRQPGMSAWHLAGANVAVVRDQVRRQRERPLTLHAQPRVLVVLGGTDPHGMTSSVVEALGEVPVALQLTVIAPRTIGADFDGIIARSPHQVRVLPFADDLPLVAREHDLVVTAAGTSVWDFACMGAPMALVCVTENQERGYAAAIDAGIAVGLSARPNDGLASAVNGLASVLTDAEALHSLAEAGRASVDGLGAWRIVSTWSELLTPRSSAEATGSVTVRRATIDDAQRLFEWRNHPSTRAVSRDSAPLVWSEHLAWFERVLGDPDRALLIGERLGNPIGTVRWDRTDDAGWEASIAVAPDSRGSGMGAALLAAAEVALQHDAAPPIRLIAAIHAENAPSRRLFRGAGYLPYAAAASDGFLRVSKLMLPPEPGIDDA